MGGHDFFVPSWMDHALRGLGRTAALGRPAAQSRIRLLTQPQRGRGSSHPSPVASNAMDVVVAGGHGQIALRLLKLLADRGDRARGLIRNAAHAADLEAAGAEAVLCDLEHEDDVSRFGESADAVVFAAGAGPGSGPERKRT